MSTVCITTPIRNRELMLKKILWKNLYSLSHPKDQTILYFHTNDNKDRTHQVLLDLQSRFRDEYLDFVVEREDYHVYDFEARMCRDRVRPALCEIFNKCLDFGKRHGDFTLFRNSDVIFYRQDDLTRLVKHDYPIVVPLMKITNRTGTYTGAYDLPFVKVPGTIRGVNYVDGAYGVLLFKNDFLMKVNPQFRKGDPGFEYDFCAQFRGKKILLDADVHCVHVEHFFNDVQEVLKIQPFLRSFIEP